MRLKPAFVALLLSQCLASAHACRDPMAASSVFANAASIAVVGADVVVRVVLSAVREDVSSAEAVAVATVTEVIQAADPRVSVGAVVHLSYRFSSCGPDPLPGASGLVLARMRPDASGLVVLYPYLRDGRGRISVPHAMREPSVRNPM